MTMYEFSVSLLNSIKMFGGQITRETIFFWGNRSRIQLQSLERGLNLSCQIKSILATYFPHTILWTRAVEWRDSAAAELSPASLSRFSRFEPRRRREPLTSLWRLPLAWVLLSPRSNSRSDITHPAGSGHCGICSVYMMQSGEYMHVCLWRVRRAQSRLCANVSRYARLWFTFKGNSFYFC